MKKLQASYNSDDNEIVKEVAQEKGAKENLSFFIELATVVMVAEDTKLIKDEPQIFNKV